MMVLPRKVLRPIAAAQLEDKSERRHRICCEPLWKQLKFMSFSFPSFEVFINAMI